MAPDRIGQQLGNYRLVRLLGGGGFAQVYLGEHVRLHTQAAIKVLHTQIAASEVDSFLTEAQTIAHLEHPHIVRVLDFDVAEGIPFLVMSYAPNGTLRQRHPKGKQLSLPTIVSYVVQLADALQYAHNEKLIHRDVKPENMLVGRRNEVLLSDFGIALVAQSSRYQSTQDVIGTILYMAPEQIQGKPRPASDQYSLAIVVYEWLCGNRPFRGSFTELCTQHIYAIPTPLREKVPTIPDDVEQVVLTALAKEPRQRFASVQAFATALKQASQAAPARLSAELPVSPFQYLSSSSLTSSQLNSPVDFPTPSAQIPTLPSSQKISSSQPSRISADQLVVLAFLLIGSAGLIYNALRTTNAHVQAMATATTAARAYNTFVSANGMMFGFDAAHTRFNPFERVLSPLNVSTLVPAWTYPAVGLIVTSPAVINNVIYFGSLDKSLYALDARSGSILWNFPTKGAAVSTPTVVNGVVYVGSNDHSLYAVDAGTGKKLWSFATGNAITSSPEVANDVVYFDSGDNSLYAMNARTGTKLWSFATIGAGISTPVVANSTVYVGSYDHSLYAVDARTGKKLWSFATGDSISSSPAVANGIVYVGSYDRMLYAVDAITGKKLWSFVTGNAIISSPTVANGIVYVGSLDGSLYAVDARIGTKLWSFVTGNLIESSPAVANGMVYDGSDDHSLYAVDAHTGTMQWSFATGDSILTSPAVANGVVYIGSGDYSFYALDARAGKKLWSYATGYIIHSSSSEADGMVYVNSADGKLYAFHLP